MNRIFIVAGDLSGDFHGAHLAQKLKEIHPPMEIYSAAGNYLAEHSHQITNLTDTAVTGIFEVFRYLPTILKKFNLILAKADELKPNLIILIDFPDFNLRLAKKLKKQGFKIFYYISPQVWAWRKKRINIIKRTIDKMMVIFPFEKEFYKKEGVDSIFVGHPLVNTINSKLTVQNTTSDKDKKQIAFLPGSRENEVKNHLPVMIETKKRLQGENLEFILIRHPHLPKKIFLAAKKEGIRIESSHKYKYLAQTDIAVSSSGTATLELALTGIPTVVIYKTNFLSWIVLKSIVKIDFISIVNILAKEEIFPELLQSEANSKNIASLCDKFLTDQDLYNETKQRLSQIKEKLGKEPSPQRAAEEIISFLKNNDSI